MINKKYVLLAVVHSIYGVLTNSTINIDIIILLLATACTGVIISNWGTISNKLQEISDTFHKAFKTLISSSVIINSLDQSKSTCLTNYDEMAAVQSIVHYARIINSAIRHIDSTFIESILKNHNALYVYVSHNRESALLVYRTEASTKAKINIDFANRGSENTGIYQYMYYPVPSGAYVFILYDLRSGNIFNAQIRFNLDAIEQMRYAHRLSWSVYPYFLYEPKYELGGIIFQWGTIFNHF